MYAYLCEQLKKVIFSFLLQFIVFYFKDDEYWVVVVDVSGPSTPVTTLSEVLAMPMSTPSSSVSEVIASQPVVCLCLLVYMC